MQEDTKKDMGQKHANVTPATEAKKPGTPTTK
jgi:hypothetical protein